MQLNYCNYFFLENLSRRNTTVLLLSSTFKTHNATFANDGNRSANISLCSHTDINKTISWLQVDLGKSYSISNVQMFYRENGEFFFDIKRQLELNIPNTHNINLSKTTLVNLNWQY